MTKRKCPQCGGGFKPRGRQMFCTPKCQRTAQAIRRPTKPLHDIKCLGCGDTITPRRKDQHFCSHTCWRRHRRGQQPQIQPAPVGDLVARIVADGFYLGDLRAELALIRKSKSSIRDLQGHLRAAILKDALWPSAGPARIALILYLLANPSLLDISVKWRHPYERRTSGVAKPTGTMIRRGMGLSHVG